MNAIAKEQFWTEWRGYKLRKTVSTQTQECQAQDVPAVFEGSPWSSGLTTMRMLRGQWFGINPTSPRASSLWPTFVYVGLCQTSFGKWGLLKEKLLTSRWSFSPWKHPCLLWKPLEHEAIRCSLFNLQKQDTFGQNASVFPCLSSLFKPLVLKFLCLPDPWIFP